jgi:NitT/TauT family transport system substrate-binding protein
MIGPACYHVLHLIPPAVAHEMNFFVDEGLVDEDGQLAYQLVVDSHAPFMFEQLTLGQTMKERGIDVCMDVKPSTIAYMRKHGYDISIIAGWRNQQANGVVGTKNLKSLRDLAGKRIGVIDHTDILVTVLSYWLQEDGLDPNRDVTWVRGVDPRRTPGALRRGEVDAGFVNSPEVEGIVGEGFNLLLDIKKQYPNGRPDRIIAATGRAIDERPEQIKSFIKGMIRAYWFVRKQPETIALIQNVERRLRRQSTDADEPRRMLSFGSAQHAEAMPFPYDGLPTGIEQYLHEAVSLGVLEEAPPVEELCRLDLARAAFAELSQRDELQADLQRAKDVRARLGY